MPGFSSVEEVRAGLSAHAYLPDRGLGTAIFLSLSLDKPLLLEGEAGVGKTEVGKVLAELLGRRLIRLQCYEGIDASGPVRVELRSAAPGRAIPRRERRRTARRGPVRAGLPGRATAVVGDPGGVR